MIATQLPRLEIKVQVNITEQYLHYTSSRPSLPQCELFLNVWCLSSFELVRSMLPAEHHKVLANIRKAEARTKRRKLAVEQQGDSESEEEEAPKAQSQR